MGSLIQEQAEGANRRRIPKWLIPALGYGVSIACLIWVYRGFDWEKELPRLQATHWRWVALAILADIAVYVCQGFRWSRLLSPLAQVSPWKTTQAVYIGLFANEVLPLRSGEVIRCYLQRRWTGLPLSVVISSAIIERLLDGIWLVLGFWVVGRFVQLPGFLMVGSRILMGLLVIVGLALLFAIFYKPTAQQAISGSRWAEALRHLVDGVHAMGRSRSFFVASFLSLLYLLLQILPILFLIIAYGLEVSPWAAPVVLVVLRLGTVVPQAPGNVGSFQALTILGLKIFGMDRGDATGFATLLFLVVTMPLWMAGFVALIATRMRLGEIHRDAHETLARSRQH
ncbi:MAG: flippase-like domain-containing protein [Bryobacterales bacterium]|nr:flippase-like domain-containing protein [Bryobacterales bacterium]